MEGARRAAGPARPPDGSRADPAPRRVGGGRPSPGRPFAPSRRLPPVSPAAREGWARRGGAGEPRALPERGAENTSPGRRARGKFSARVPGFPPAPRPRTGEPPTPLRRRPAGPRPSPRLAVRPPPPLPPAAAGAAGGSADPRLAGPALSWPQRGRGARTTRSRRLRLRPGPRRASRPAASKATCGSPLPAAVTLNRPERGLFFTRKPAAGASVRSAGTAGQPATWSPCAHRPGTRVSPAGLLGGWKVMSQVSRQGLGGCRGAF